MADSKRVATVGLKKNDAFYTLSPEKQKTTRQPVYKGYVAMNDIFYDVAFWLEKDTEKVAKGFFLSGSVSEQWKPEDNQEAAADSSPNDDIPF